MPILLSDGAPDSYRLGDQALDAVYLGDDKMWPLLSAQGMTKSGTQATGSNSYNQITGWAPNAGSTVTNNALVVSGAGVCTISASVTWTNSGATRMCRVLRNDTVAWTSSNAGTSTSVSGSFSTTVEDGDRLTLESFTSSTLAMNRVVSTSGTFLLLVPV